MFITKIRAIIAGVLLVSAASLAHATPVTWTLSGAQFNTGGGFKDGSFATGSFDFDADTTTYSNVNIVTNINTYLTADVGSFGINTTNASHITMYDGYNLLRISFANALTNAGGAEAISPLGYPNSWEGNCASNTCGSGTIRREFVAGLVAVVSVAEPGNLAVFGLGLAGLGFARRRKAA